MNGLRYILIVAVGILAFWIVVAPRAAWRALRGWRYSHPSRREPSDRAYVLYRVSGVLILVAMVINLVVASQRDAERDTPEEADYQACLERERAADEAGGGLGVVPPDSPCWDRIPEGED